MRTVSASPIGVSGPAGPSGARASSADHRRRAGAGERDLQPRHLREAAGGDVGIADRAEPVQQRRAELRPGDRLDHRPVAEGQHREHLAPGDLTRLLARGGRSQEEVLAQASGVGQRRVHARVLTPHRVRDHVAHRRLEQPARCPQDVDRLRADHLVAEHRGLGVRLVDDRLNVRPRAPRRGSWRCGWWCRPRRRRHARASAAPPSSWRPR